jgi:hypothetical protein
MIIWRYGICILQYPNKPIKCFIWVLFSGGFKLAILFIIGSRTLGPVDVQIILKNLSCWAGLEFCQD